MIKSEHTEELGTDSLALDRFRQCRLYVRRFIQPEIIHQALYDHLSATVLGLVIARRYRGISLNCSERGVPLLPCVVPHVLLSYVFTELLTVGEGLCCARYTVLWLDDAERTVIYMYRCKRVILFSYVTCMMSVIGDLSANQMGWDFPAELLPFLLRAC